MIWDSLLQTCKNSRSISLKTLTFLTLASQAQSTPKYTWTLTDVLTILYSEFPDVNKTPNVYYWYLFMYTFSNDLLKKWVENGNAKNEEGKK